MRVKFRRVHSPSGVFVAVNWEENTMCIADESPYCTVAEDVAAYGMLIEGVKERRFTEYFDGAVSVWRGLKESAICV